MADSTINNKQIFYIVDFDRTLVDSDKLTEIFVEIAEEHQAISKEQVLKADADMKSRGDTFDTASYVRDHLSEQGNIEKWEALEKQFIHESRSLNYMLPGANELIEWLSAHNKKFGILTYGNPLWQRIKMTAAGFNHVPHIIMTQKEKGRFISGWHQEDGSFQLPHEFGHGIVNEIVLIDDKAVSFSEFPDAPSRGYWVLDPAHELPSQQGTVQGNVQRHKDLFSVIESL
jgi:phosphoserine phosphatase